jgi:uncharacterized protein (TIGR02265 family)
MAVEVALKVGGEPRAFGRPSFTEDVDLDHFLKRCPATATTRGTFFVHVIDHLRAKLGQIPADIDPTLVRRRLPFGSYPLTDFMRLAYEAAVRLYPLQSSSEALRRVGWMSYPSFASTMAGRVVLFAFGRTIEDVIRASSKAYGVGLSGAKVRATRIGDRHWVYELRDVHSFVDTYHYGVLEGAVIAHGFRAEIGLRRGSRHCDADFDLHWS